MPCRQLDASLPATNPSWFLSLQHRHGYQREHHISAWDVEVHSNQGHNFGQYPSLSFYQLFLLLYELSVE